MLGFCIFQGWSVTSGGSDGRTRGEGSHWDKTEEHLWMELYNLNPVSILESGSRYVSSSFIGIVDPEEPLWKWLWISLAGWH